MGLTQRGFYGKEVDTVVRGDEPLISEMDHALRSALVNTGAVSAPSTQEREWLAYVQIRTDDERIIIGAEIRAKIIQRKTVYELRYVSTWLNRKLGDREKLVHGMLQRPVASPRGNMFLEMAEELCDQIEIKIVELQGVRTGE